MDKETTHGARLGFAARSRMSLMPAAFAVLVAALAPDAVTSRSNRSTAEMLRAMAAGTQAQQMKHSKARVEYSKGKSAGMMQTCVRSSRDPFFCD